MPILEMKADCSETMYDKIDILRGNMDIQLFLMELLKIGIGHAEEELLLRDRQETYDRIAKSTGHYLDALKARQLRPVTETIAPISAAMSLTRPKIAS